MIDTGTIINDKYHLREKIAAGGGGIVWKAQSRGGEPVALKILSMDSSKSREAVTGRFKREFELFKKVSHPNIAKIYDFGVDEENEVYFFTSELLSGGDLKSMVRAPVPVLEYLLLQSLRALEYLRNFGILHLDIKPQNLLLRNEGDKPRLVLIDFGLATFNPPDRPGGTPNYMSPEVAVRRLGLPLHQYPSPDHRSDLYSLGVTFYHILTGVQPFAAYKEGKPDNDAIMQAHLKERRPPPPSFHNRSVPPYLDAVVMRMMERVPDDRYQAAVLAAQALCFRSPNHLEVENRETIGAYVPEEGMLIGRREEKKMIEEAVLRTVAGKGHSIVCIAGGWGTGKTRVLKSIKPFAQQQEMDVYSDLAYGDIKIKRPTAFLIDDLFLLSADVASRADIFALKHLILHVSRLPGARCFFGFTLNTDLMKIDEAAKMLGIEPSSIEVVTLNNFTSGEISEYLAFLLGEMPPKEIIDELGSVTFGNPKFITDVVKRMMEKGELFSYLSGRAGAKALEVLGFSFVHAESPSSLSEYLLGEVEKLPEGAKMLARRLACWRKPVGADELLPFPSTALEILLLSGLVKRNEDGLITFANPAAFKVIEMGIDPDERASIHDSIAEHLRSRIPSPLTGEGGGEGDIFFALDLHLACGSDPTLQREAALKLAVEVPKRLHPVEAAELLGTVEKTIADPEVRSHLLIAMGQSFMRLGRWNDAKETFERLKKVASLRGDEQLGLLALRRRKLSEAREIFTRALQGACRSPITDHQSRVHLLRLENYLAGVDLREGNYESAAETYKRAAGVAADLPEEYRSQIMNNELGEALILMGRSKESVEILERELEQGRLGGQSERIVNCLRLLGDAHRKMGFFNNALEEYGEALDLARRYHFFEYQLRIRNSLAHVLKIKGGWLEAVEHYKFALDLAMQLEGKATAVDIMVNIGFAYNKLERFDEAIEYLELALDFAKGPDAESSSQIREITPQIQVALGHAHYKMGELLEAEKHLEVAREYYSSLSSDSHGYQDRLTLYNLYGTLVEIYLARNKGQKAKEFLPILEELAEHLPEAAEHFRKLRDQVEGLD